MALDTPDEKGVSKRKKLEKVVKDSKGKVVPEELENETVPEPWDETLFYLFFDMYQRGKEFYQTVYYYEQVMDADFDGEDIALLFAMWKEADKYYFEQDQKKNSLKKSSKQPLKSKQVGR